MKKITARFTVFAMLALLGVSEAAAQQRVTGRVTNAQTAAPVAGALVTVEDADAGILTGQDGRYSIQAPPSATLNFSALGYARRREPVQNRSVVDVALETDPIVREEVVAVGYGRQTQTTVIRGGVIDRPQPASRSTVTLRFQLIEADGFSTRDPAIAEVETALRGLFRFTGYRLLAQTLMANLVPMVPLRTSRDSWADYQVTQKVHADGIEYGILTDVRSITRNEGGTAAVELAVLLYRTQPSGGSDILLRTSVRVPDGQTVVLGSAPGTPVENTIILAVQPQVEGDGSRRPGSLF